MSVVLLRLRVVQLMQLVGVHVGGRLEVRRPRDSHHPSWAAVKVAHVVSGLSLAAPVAHLLLDVLLHPSSAAVGAEVLWRPLEVVGGQGVRRRGGPVRQAEVLRRRGGRAVTFLAQRPLQDGTVGRPRRARPSVGGAWK